MRKSSIIPVLMLVASLALGGAAAAQGPGAARSTASDPTSREHGVQLIEAGHALEMSGQRDGALADYTEAIESRQLDRDEQARALFARGLLLDGMNRFDDALQDYSAALALLPKFAAALNNRANVYRRLRRFAEARRDYQASLAAGNPQGQYPYYGLGQIAEAEGRVDQAKAFYAKALAVAPDFVLANQKIASLDEPIHLHPPTVKLSRAELVPSQQPVHLRAPVRALKPVPAAYERGSPPLKPALDEARSLLGPQVQLGAWRTEAEAIQGWNRALGKAGSVLDGYSPHIMAVDLPGAGRYYRLRVAPDGKGPKSLCAALSAKGLDCMEARD